MAKISHNVWCLVNLVKPTEYCQREVWRAFKLRRKQVSGVLFISEVLLICAYLGCENGRNYSNYKQKDTAPSIRFYGTRYCYEPIEWRLKSLQCSMLPRLTAWGHFCLRFFGVPDKTDATYGILRKTWVRNIRFFMGKIFISKFGISWAGFELTPIKNKVGWRHRVKLSSLSIFMHEMTQKKYIARCACAFIFKWSVITSPWLWLI